MKTKYALRALTCLASDAVDQPLLASEIARNVHVPEKFLQGILGELVRHSFIRSRKGRRGGYHLARSPGSISLLAVIRACQGSIAPVVCVEQAGYRCEGCERVCPLQKLMSIPYTAYAEDLEAKTIEDLARIKGPRLRAETETSEVRKGDIGR